MCQGKAPLKTGKSPLDFKELDAESKLPEHPDDPPSERRMPFCRDTTLQSLPRRFDFTPTGFSAATGSFSVATRHFGGSAGAILPRHGSSPSAANVLASRRKAF